MGIRIDMQPTSAPEIFLVRHGKPDLNWPGQCDAAAYDVWSHAYRDCGLEDGSTPSEELLQRIVGYSRVAWVCSPLRRARASALILSNGATPKILAELEEVRLPAAGTMEGMRSAESWVNLSVQAYNSGRHNGCEPPAALRVRATAAGAALISYAQGVDCVVAVGHGLINRLVADALLEQGMTLQAGEPGEYWRWQHFHAAPGPLPVRGPS